MRYLFVFYLLIQGAICFAQSGSHGASPNNGSNPWENIIFEDNFSDDSLGNFPHKWKRAINYAIRTGTKTHAIVRKEGVYKVLGTDGMTYVKPICHAALADSFTVECEFMLKDKEDCLAFAFCLDESGKNTLDSDFYQFLFFFYYEDQHYGISYGKVEVPTRELSPYNSSPPVMFSHNHWYHLGFSYNHRHISCDLDSTRILDIPDGGFVPSGISIRLDNSAICKHFVVKNSILPDFNQLITEKKIVTHAILFETNKTLISENSNPFLAQLAEWLLKNTSVSIEIDGYTDNIGSAVSNQILSVKRAEEVKKQLVAKGVPAIRLTTKGLGATMPLKSNTTEQGRSENRRVELVLLRK